MADAMRKMYVNNYLHTLLKSGAIAWRQGSAKPMRSRLAAVRVHAAHRQHGTALRPEEWLVIEWPTAEAAPTKYHLSNLPGTSSLKKLVSTIHMRWRIERDYQELKDEIGIDHFEGRSWRGFHHHAALCIAAYGFIAAERARLFPLQPSPSSQCRQASNRSRAVRRTNAYRRSPFSIRTIRHFIVQVLMGQSDRHGWSYLLNLYDTVVLARRLGW